MAKRIRYGDLYRCWLNMNQRCHNPNHPRYAQYGGRGILVCERWRSFDNFSDDMAPMYQGMTLDRIDNDKGYSKDNCRWATMDVQASNRPRAKFYEYKGQQYTLKALAEVLGIPQQYLYEKVRRFGKTPDEAAAQFFSGVASGRIKKTDDYYKPKRPAA